ncbi:MAG: hypothetical protein ACREQJ_08450, partial [Candidatus Binatia bacterium]
VPKKSDADQDGEGDACEVSEAVCPSFCGRPPFSVSRVSSWRKPHENCEALEGQRLEKRRAQSSDKPSPSLDGRAPLRWSSAHATA